MRIAQRTEWALSVIGLILFVWSILNFRHALDLEWYFLAPAAWVAMQFGLSTVLLCHLGFCKWRGRSEQIFARAVVVLNLGLVGWMVFTYVVLITDGFLPLMLEHNLWGFFARLGRLCFPALRSPSAMENQNPRVWHQLTIEARACPESTPEDKCPRVINDN